ncbi:hypothetical protein Syun_025296 [Stephania yunnanensis]|uniref:Uncharacterized protein n=1 Tax=Stephania yunnanensis TaxID=152371 RepID=A0AAP0HVN7_9MAGN
MQDFCTNGDENEEEMNNRETETEAVLLLFLEDQKQRRTPRRLYNRGINEMTGMPFE